MTDNSNLSNMQKEKQDLVASYEAQLRNAGLREKDLVSKNTKLKDKI